MGFSYFRGSAWHCPWQILGETRQLSPCPPVAVSPFCGFASATVAVNYPVVVLITLMSGCASRWVQHKQPAIARTMPSWHLQPCPPSVRYGYAVPRHRTMVTCHECWPRSSELLSTCNCQAANGQCHYSHLVPSSKRRLIKVQANLNYLPTSSMPLVMVMDVQRGKWCEIER